MPGPGCVSDPDLRAFVLGELPERLAGPLAAHLEGCPACEQAARRLDALTDPLLDSLRQALRPTPGGQAVTRPEPGGPPAAGPVPAPPGYPGQPPGPFGRFQIVRELGRGGFGIVFLAHDPALGREVALKVPRPEAVADPMLRERFLREARAAATLDHPNVVPVHEAGQVGPVCYIVSAYCPGPTLAAWLRQQPGPLAPRLAAALLASLADAVQHAHQHGIFHRDLKPGNVLLMPRRAEGRVSRPDHLDFIPRLTDFGLAKLLEAEVDQTSSGVLLGTPPYMAPEQAEGWPQGVGAATDVYALGAILYELLTGRPPFLGASVVLTLEQVRAGQPRAPRQVRADVPRDLETICLKCLRRDPGQRYASAAELADDLRRFLRHEPVRARPLGPLARLLNWCRRPERVRDAGAVAFFSGAVAVGTNAGGLILLAAGLLPSREPVPAVGFFLALIFGFGVPQILVAFRTWARSPVALWGGLALPLLLLTYLECTAFGLVPSGGLTEATRDPSAWQAQATTMLFFGVFQVAFFLVALVAYYANRHIPGFLPDRGVERAG